MSNFKKVTKRTLSVVLALIMTLAIGCSALISVSAYGETANIKVEDGNENATYYAYRLLNLETSTNQDGETNYAYTLNSKYQNILLGMIDGSADAYNPEKAVIDYLTTLSADDTRDFADELYTTVYQAGLDADSTANAANDYTFEGVVQGYYLIVEVTVVDGTLQARSLTLLDTLGKENISVYSKTDVPQMDKKILEDEDDSTIGWNDIADYDVGDEVSYKLTGTMPSNIEFYDTYTYIFHDWMDEGLDFNPETVVVTVDGKTIDAKSYTIETTCDDDCTFEIVFTDLKAATSGGNGITLTDDTQVVVTYTATLTPEAVYGLPGNENTAYLEFSNDAYDEGSTGHTPEDQVLCFTFSLSLSKISPEGEALNGAKFVLYADEDCTQQITVTKAEDGTYYIDPTNTTSHQIKVEEDTITYQGDYIEVGTNVIVNGLEADEGEGSVFYLKEIQSPEGYNNWIDPIKLTLTGTYAHRDDYLDKTTTAGLTALVAVANINGEDQDLTTNIQEGAAGNVALSVINTTNVELPKTGEFGGLAMQIFGGAAILAGVGIIALVVIRRRKNVSK